MRQSIRHASLPAALGMVRYRTRCSRAKQTRCSSPARRSARVNSKVWRRRLSRLGIFI